MSTAFPPHSEPLAVGAWGDDGEADSKSERYLARRLAAASADFKGVALTTFLLGAGVSALGWVACGVAVEHWLVPGGLDRWARWAWLLTGLAALAVATIRWVVPLVRYRVNLVYAARVIEREHPELHNDLVNTVLVKAHPEGNAATVVKSLERRAAKRLSTVSAEAVIDRTPAVRLAYALAVLVMLTGVYGLLAPKSVLATTARLLAPWARVAAPTRVRFEPPRLRWRMPGEEPVAVAPAAAGGPNDAAPARDDPLDPRGVKVEAGVATLVRGRQLVVAGTIRGLRRDERPIVAVTPLLDTGQVDGAAVPWRLEMTCVGSDAGGAAQRYSAVLPDGARGLDQPLAFTLQAGDGRSEPVRVSLVDSPSLLVREVRYEFPAYMGRERETVAWQGDLRAVEGTRVVIVTECNQPLESAWIDFDCDGTRDLKMKVGTSDLSRATATFVLALNPERTAPEHASYRLLFQPRGTALAGGEQVQAEKLEHRIEVQADLAPEISIEEPRESPALVPPGAPVTVRVRALDPDFGLARVGIETRVQGGAAQPEIVLPGSERREAFSGGAQIVPERLGAGAGSTLEYRGIAVDARPGQPNVAHTPWRAMRIDASAPPRPPEKPLPRADAAEPEEGAGGMEDAPTGDGDRSEENGGRGDGPREAGQRGQDQQPRPADGDAERMEGNEAVAGDAQEKPADGAEANDSPRPGAEGNERKSGQGNDQKKPQQQSNDRQPGGQRGDTQPGESQPGQQGGAASGSQQGGKQPQAGATNKQPGAAQGEGNEPGAAAAGQGRGSEGKQGSGSQPEGRRADDGSGAGGGRGDQQQPAERSEGAGMADGQSSGGPSKERGGGGKPGTSPSESGQSGNQQRGGKTGGGQQPRSAVSADGTNDGEAMERILDHRRQSGADSRVGDGGQTPRPPAGDGAQENASAGGQEDAGRKPGTKAGPEKGSDTTEPSDSSKAGEAAPKAPACADADGTPCGKEGCSSCAGGASKSSSGKTGAGQGQQGQGQQGQGQQGQGQQGQGQQGQGQQGQGQQGQGQQGQGQQGQGQQGQGQQGQGQQGQGQQGQGQQGQGQQGQGQQGQGQQGQGQQGQGQQGQGQQGQGQQGQGQQGQGQQGQGQQGQGQQGQGQGDASGGSSEGKSSGEGREATPDAAAQKAPAKDGSGAGDSEKAGETGGKPGGQRAAGPPPADANQTSAAGGGGWSEGAAAAGGAGAEGPAPSGETEWGPQDLEHARNAADLAVDHLRSSVESGRTDVLDQLGWTREQARAFLDRWEAMRRQAESPDPARRGEFERVLRSLGLRPGGVQSSRDLPADVKGGQAEGRRSRPPSDYRERFKAYLQGTSGEPAAAGQPASTGRDGAGEKRDASPKRNAGGR